MPYVGTSTIIYNSIRFKILNDFIWVILISTQRFSPYLATEPGENMA